MNKATVSLGIWSAVLQWSRFAIAALVFIGIANWLTLAEIGAFAIAASPVRFLQVVHRSGITDAVIIVRAGPEKEASTNALFALSIVVGIGLAAFLFFGSRLAEFIWVDAVQISQMISWLAIIPVFNGLAAVPEGILRQTLRIKALALRTLAVQSVAAGLTFGAVANGFGPWSLVVFLIANAGFGALTAMIVAKWCPLGVLRLRDVAASFRLFAVLSLQALVNNALQPVLQVCVGIWFGLADAGAFQIALRFLGLLDALAVAPIRYLALPLLSGLGKSGERFASAVPRGMKITSILVSPVYLGAAATAPMILHVFVGLEHAQSTALMLQIFCVFGLVNAISMVVLQASIAAGYAHVMLWRSLALFVTMLVLLAPALTMSADAVAASAAVAATGVALGVFVYVPPLIKVSRKAMYRAAVLPVLIALGASLTVWGFSKLAWLDALPPPLQLAALIFLGLLSYALAMWPLSKMGTRFKGVAVSAQGSHR